MSQQIALLRGVNVGGRHLAPMAKLREDLQKLGLEKVQTVLQSGNVVFESELDPGEVEALLERKSMDFLGFPVLFFVRTAGELGSILKANPFSEMANKDPGRLVAMFLKEQVDPMAIRAVLEANPGPEQIQAVERQLYIAYPDGIGASKLKLPWEGTARNWNTLLRLGRMCGVST